MTGGDCQKLEETARDWRRQEETERDSKSLPSPADLCIKHQGWHVFTSTSTGTPQSCYGNVDYHCKPACVWLREPLPLKWPFPLVLVN